LRNINAPCGDRQSNFFRKSGQSELALWSDLAKKLVATRSVPEALEAYGECVSAQMKMTAEDGQHLFNDW
jgi:hypothetical protein